MHDDALYQLLHQDPDAGMKALIDRYAGLVYAVVRSKLSPCVFCAADLKHCVAEVSAPFLFGAQKETGPNHQRKRRAGEGTRMAPCLRGTQEAIA